MTARRAFALLFGFLALFVWTACAAPQQPTLDLTPESRSMVSGDVVQLTVTRQFLGGPIEDVTKSHGVTYTASPSTLATVSDDGAVTAGDEAGTVLVRAYDATSGATAVGSFEITPAKIASIDVAPSPAIVLARGDTRQFTATAHLTNGVTKDVTTQVLWSSSDESIATVGNEQTNKGLVTAISSGNANIVATDNETNVQGRSIAFVTGAEAPQLKAIVVTPSPGIVAVGKTQPYAAQGVFSDGSTADITATAKWSSSRPDVATVGASGIVTGVAAGDTTITAQDPAPGGTIQGSAAAKVTP